MMSVSMLIKTVLIVVVLGAPGYSGGRTVCKKSKNNPNHDVILIANIPVIENVFKVSIYQHGDKYIGIYNIGKKRIKALSYSIDECEEISISDIVVNSGTVITYHKVNFKFFKHVEVGPVVYNPEPAPLPLPPK